MPDRVLLLGAAGTVGSRVALAFLDAGYAVRCLARSRGHRNLGEITARGGEVSYGDMNDDAALSAAFGDCRFFVHSAAPYPWSGLHIRQKKMLGEWVPQLRRHFELAKQAGIERAVFTSSLSCIGLAPKGVPADETLAYDARKTAGGNYYTVKAAMEKAVLEVTAGGPPTVLVNPTGLVGEGSRNANLSAVCVFFQGLTPFMVDATMSFVDCRDVARGHVLALKHGRAGERYILGGWNTTLREMAEKVCALAGLHRPMILPRTGAYVGAIFAEWWAWLCRGTPGALSLTSYYHMQYGQHYSSEKARKELGYEPATDLKDAILRELTWHGVALKNHEGNAQKSK